MTPGVPYHTIIGDRGRGDSPNSSDGVALYWSSHMNDAVTENIVAFRPQRTPEPAGDRRCNAHPQEIREVRKSKRDGLQKLELHRTSRINHGCPAGMSI